MPLWGVLFAVMCAACWAVSPIAADRGTEIGKCTSNEINPIRSWSFFLTALISMLIAGHGHLPAAAPLKIQLLIGLSVLFNYILGDVFYYIAIRILGVNIAIPIANAYPIFLVFLAAAILGESISFAQFAAIFIVAAGIALLKTGGAKSGGSMSKSGKQWAAGLLFTVLAGLDWSFSAILTKIILKDPGIGGAATFSFYRACWLIVISYPVHWLVRYFFPDKSRPLSAVPLKAKCCYWVSGIIGLGIGYMMYAYCVKTLPIALITPITATSPLMAALYAHFIMKQKLYPLQWLGVVLIIAGSVIVSL